MSEHALSCDTSVLLYLGRIGQLHLLPALFEAVFVPAQVTLELDMGRLLRADTVDPRQLTWAMLVDVQQKEMEKLPPNRLGPGERSVIAYAQFHGHCMAGLDDRMARLLAEDLGLKVIGVVGILLKGKRAGLIPFVQPLLDQLRRSGFRLQDGIYHEALRLADENF